MNSISFVLNKFGLNDDYTDIRKINSGHINSTYIIIYSDSESYILQKINNNVFNKPENIMSNIEKICNCIKSEITCPVFLKCNGKPYAVHENHIWRIYPYINNSVSYDSLSDEYLICQFGSVLGRFHCITKHENVSEYFIIIDNFHNTSMILNNLIKLKNNEYSMEFCFFENAIKYSYKFAEKNLPMRVTHNDVKCSNVLFDISDNSGITLIDFDTVMPGFTEYDFGDGTRSACITNDKINLVYFDAYCKGYFNQNKVSCAEDFFLGTFCITAELSARYFYDFLSGQNYFADKTPEQKLFRCRQLITTAQSILDNKNQIISIIEKYMF